MRNAALLALVVIAAACQPATDDSAAARPRAETPAPARELGAWTGKGSTTLGFVSESGSFRITWQARNQNPARPGTFQLTLRSGISGRPMQVIADHLGAGGDTVEFGDDPRIYEFLVESSGIDWSISVQETFAPRP
jgi:hypothetical protein